MRSIEAEGSSIDEAIEKALATLQVTREQVHIDILNDAAPGLLGFGGRRASVRATVRELVPLVAELAGRTVSQETDPTDLDVVLRKVLETVLSFLGASCRVSLGTGDPGVRTFVVEGDSSGLVIGRRGQTLDALEYLLNRIAGHRPGSEGTRVRVDVEHYRERRQESLEQLARRLAAKAKETGRIVTLNPLTPRDRRTVHLALDADPDVTTRSEGDGHFRRVLIVPQQSRRGRDDLR